MNPITLLVFVASAWCLLDGSAALQGGTPVNETIPQPFITTLLAKDKAGTVIKRCEATIIKRTNGNAHFLTAAECVVEKEATSYHMVYYNGNAVGSPVEVPVSGTFHIHKEYDEKKKSTNIAVFSTKDEFKDIPTSTIPDDSGYFLDNVAYYQWMLVDQQGESNSYRLYSVNERIFAGILCLKYYPSSPLKDYTVCVTRSKNGQGLSEGQEGTPVLRRDQKDPKQFSLLGIATVVRPETATLDIPCIEFLSLKPYRSWIESLDL